MIISMNTESLYEREDHSGMYTKKLAKSKNKQNGEKINAKKNTKEKKMDDVRFIWN